MTGSKNTFVPPNLEIKYVDPRELYANPWNPNETDHVADKQLEESISRFKMIDAIKVRQLADGRLQILGGKHRNETCIKLGYKEVPIINLGTVSESTAREISLIDNGRYGSNDPSKLLDVISFISKEDNVDLSSFLPYDEVAVDAALAAKSIDWGDKFPEDEDDFDDGLSLDSDEPSKEAAITRTTLKFSVNLDDSAEIEQIINAAIKKHRLFEVHSQVNAGNALSILLLGDPSIA